MAGIYPAFFIFQFFNCSMLSALYTYTPAENASAGVYRLFKLLRYFAFYDSDSWVFWAENVFYNTNSLVIKLAGYFYLP